MPKTQENQGAPIAAQTEKCATCGRSQDECAPDSSHPFRPAEQVDAARFWIEWQRQEGVNHHTIDDWPIRFAKAYAASLKQETQPPSEKQLDAIVLCVAELPDRSSPDDWPEAMLVTAEELKTIIRETLASSSPLETPAAGTHLETCRKHCSGCKCKCHPAPADTGAATTLDDIKNWKPANPPEKFRVEPAEFAHGPIDNYAKGREPLTGSKPEDKTLRNRHCPSRKESTSMLTTKKGAISILISARELAGGVIAEDEFVRRVESWLPADGSLLQATSGGGVMLANLQHPTMVCNHASCIPPGCGMTDANFTMTVGTASQHPFYVPEKNCIRDEEDYPETSTIGIAKLAENMTAKMASPGDTPQPQTRFAEFDDADHPCHKWWEEHGQFIMSGGGRREFIWACRGWIAREQLAEGVEVTGDSLHEKPQTPDAGEEKEK